MEKGQTTFTTLFAKPDNNNPSTLKNIYAEDDGKISLHSKPNAAESKPPKPNAGSKATSKKKKKMSFDSDE